MRDACDHAEVVRDEHDRGAGEALARAASLRGYSWGWMVTSSAVVGFVGDEHLGHRWSMAIAIIAR